nr:monodehydroascorbate reductase [Tanacetum cinerariifolium]
TMADVNINAPAGQAPAMGPPVRTDDQILPRIRWVPIGKSNCYPDLDKSQSNPIYKIAVDLLKHTNFFRAFTGSSTIPSIYIQQFWDTVLYDKSAGCYRCQLDEQWFVLTKDTLREALQITPVNNNQAFVTPPSSDALINFFNELGYPKLVRNLSNVVANDMFQPWRALTTIINLCLMGKTSGIWEEFTQSIHTFIEDKRNLTRHTSGKKKDTLIVIPSIRFTKLIIHHLQRRHKFHLRPDSPLHFPKEHVLGYLKFSAKGTKREVFEMPIPGSLITADIQEASYYQEYLAKVAKHRRYLTSETRSDPDSPASKPTKPAKKPKSTAPKAPPRPSVSTPVTSVQPAKKHTLKSVAESVAEDAPAKEPQVAAKDADMQKALEESLKSVFDVPRGSLPPVVIREPESGKYQPLLEVPRKGKAKSDSEEESEKVVHGVDLGGQGEGQAGSNLDEQSEGQAGPDPGNVEADEQSMPSPVVHAGSDREHMDLEVQENLKFIVEEQVLLEEPASSSGTLSSLQHLSKDISFGDLFFSDKPLKADNDKATAETKVESMVSVMIQQDMSSIPPMTSPIIDLTSRPESPKRIGELEHIMANLIQENKGLEERLDKHGARLYTLEKLDIPHKVSKAVSEVVTKAVDWAIQAPLRNRFRDLPEADMKEILHQRMWETESYKSHEDHMQLTQEEEKESRVIKNATWSPPHQPPPLPPAGPSRASGAPGASGSSQVPPPPPPPSSTNQESQSKGSAAPSSSKTAASAEYQAWTTTDIRIRPSISLALTDLQMDEDMALDEQAQSSNDEDIGKPAWLIPSSDVPVPTNSWASALASNYSPPPEDSLLVQTGDIDTFMDWFCKRQGITELKPQDLEGPAFKIVKVFHPDVIHLQYKMEECHKLLTDNVDDSILRHNVSKPLPLGGPPVQVTIQTDFFFNKDLEYLRYGSKGSRPALSISKMKAAYYLGAGLEQMVPDQFWIEEDAVRTHMWILSVVRIEVFSMYGYDYMKKVVLRRADLNEHVIAERDFKYLYPSDFKDLYLLNLQGHLNHLPPKDKKILTTTVNQ